MRDIRSVFRGTTARVRVKSVTWDDTSWPNRQRGLVQIGFNDKDGASVLVEMNKRNARAAAIHLLREAEGR